VCLRTQSDYTASWGSKQMKQTEIEHHFELHPRNDAELAAWRPIIAAARLNEKVPGEQVRLLASVRAGFGVKDSYLSF